MNRRSRRPYAVSLLAALLAGWAAWEFLSCRPDQVIAVPAETRLVHFSPSGRYLVTWDRKQGPLTLWDAANRHIAHQFHVPPSFVANNSSTNSIFGFYNISDDDRWLALAAEGDNGPHLNLFDLTESMAKPVRVGDLAPFTNLYQPRPAFHGKGQTLAYLLPGSKRVENKALVGSDELVLYDPRAERRPLRVPGAHSVLGQVADKPDEWLFDTSTGIERWDTAAGKCLEIKKRWWPAGFGMGQEELASDGHAMIILASMDDRAPKPHKVACFRRDLVTDTTTTVWEYTFPASATAFWNMTSWPNHCFLIKTLDEQGSLVQDLLDVSTGKNLARFPLPLDVMENLTYSYMGQKSNTGAGLVQSLGRTGALGIDAGRKVIVSQQRSQSVLWEHFPSLMRCLKLTPPPAEVTLKWFSAQTGRLMGRAPLAATYSATNWESPIVAVHPSEPYMALIDQPPQGDWQLQFWSMPPSRPWYSIVAVALAAGILAAGFQLGLLWLLRRVGILRACVVAPTAARM